jgi:hypothetical protein
LHPSSRLQPLGIQEALFFFVRQLGLFYSSVEERSNGVLAQDLAVLYKHLFYAELETRIDEINYGKNGTFSCLLGFLTFLF